MENRVFLREIDDFRRILYIWLSCCGFGRPHAKETHCRNETDLMEHAGDSDIVTDLLAKAK